MLTPARRSAHRALVLLAAALTTVVLLPPVGARADVGVVDRVAGEDRVTTAVAASQTGWSSAQHVVVGVADDWPDAIAASAYAASVDGPLLLTPSDALPAVVADEIARLGASTATVLGGSATISDSVVDDLSGVVGTVERIGGESRYDTAGLLAARTGVGDGGRVAVTLGADTSGGPGWPDAMTAGTLAALDDPIPTLLTRPDALPEASADAIADLAPAEVVVVGGAAAVSDTVVSQIEGLGPDVVRAAGPDRYATSIAVADVAAQSGLASPDAVFVSGESYADALGAAAVAARTSSPMLLVPSGQLHDDVDSYVRDSALQRGVLVGGQSAVEDLVAAQIDAAITGAPRPEPEPKPAPEPTPEPEPEPPSYNGHVFRFDLALWDWLADCESGGSWSINTGNGYYGGLQFSQASWRAVGGSGSPHTAPRLEQIYRGELLQARQGWGAWPACSRKLGLR